MPTPIPPHLPGLLGLPAGPVQSTHVSYRAVRLGESAQPAEHRVWQHDGQRQYPGGRDDPVGVRARLPRPRLEGVTDSAVALDGNGHQAEGGDGDRDTWKVEKGTETSLGCRLKIQIQAEGGDGDRDTWKVEKGTETGLGYSLKIQIQAEGGDGDRDTWRVEKGTGTDLG